MIRKKVLGSNRTFLHTPLFDGANLFTDSSFTSGITGWSAVSSATLSHETSIGNTDSKSLKVTAANATSGAEYTTSSIAAGSKRIFKFWVRGTGASVGKFVRGKITANGDASSQDTVAIKLTTSFQEVWCTYLIPATGTITLTVQGVDLASTEVIYIDDVTCDTYRLPQLSVSGRYIFYNNQRVWWRGTNYGNTPTEGQSNANFATQEKMLRNDAADLVDQGVNCIRIYNNSYSRNDYGRGLDVFYQYGIGVQLWYFIWIQSSDYTQATGTANRATKVADHALWVSRLKNHPAMVGYFFGSEGNYHVAEGGTPGENNTQTDWITLVNECAAAAKAEDPYRLTSTSHGGVNDLIYDAMVPDMDIWGYTIYRGGPSQVHRWSSIDSIRDEILSKTRKPCIITELGTGIYSTSMPNNRHPVGQSESDIKLLSRAEQYSDVIQGTMYFQFSDQMNDESMYGKCDSVAGGTSVTRPKRHSWYAIKNYYNTNPLPIY